MTKDEQRNSLIAILDKINPQLPEPAVVDLLSEVIREVGAIKYGLRDMPLVTGALNLLISSVVLDYEEKETDSYADSMALKTIIDLARI